MSLPKFEGMDLELVQMLARAIKNTPISSQEKMSLLKVFELVWETGKLHGVREVREMLETRDAIDVDYVIVAELKH